MSIPRLHAPDAMAAKLVELPQDEAHHLRTVLRLRAGAPVAIFDGEGREWAGRVASVDRKSVTIERLDAVTPVAEPSVRITLAIGLLKGGQMDSVVRAATMLGVVAIQPMTTSHVAVQLRARASGAGVERWRRVALASAKQCRRAVVPAIPPLAPLQTVLAQGKFPDRPRSDRALLLMCVEPSAAASAQPLSWGERRKKPPSRALILIGPEGGWAPAEIDLAVSSGARLVHLGPRTLRAETSPIVLLSALWTSWGWS